MQKKKKTVISSQGRLTLAHGLFFRMPVASMATQTQIGERIKEEIRSIPASYIAKQKMNACLLNFSVFRDTYTKPHGLGAAGDL